MQCLLTLTQESTAAALSEVLQNRLSEPNLVHVVKFCFAMSVLSDLLLAAAAVGAHAKVSQHTMLHILEIIVVSLLSCYPEPHEAGLCHSERAL